MDTTWYEVEVISRKTILVELDNESKIDPKDEASELASNEGFSFIGDTEVLSCSELAKHRDVEIAKKYADEVLSL
jgi:hypothetical protein